MRIEEQIKNYMSSLPATKSADMQALHRLILSVFPKGKLWFFDGKNEENRTVANPTIGYGTYLAPYANGKTEERFQVGMSANTTGISIYIMGIKDKTYLAAICGKEIGKASATGYCIKFKKLEDIHRDVLEKAIRYGVAEALKL